MLLKDTTTDISPKSTMTPGLMEAAATSSHQHSVAGDGDPLGWPLWQKYYTVILESSFTVMAQLGSALINTSYVKVASDLYVIVEEASYSFTIFMLFAGIFPLFIAPFATIYGRRPLYPVFTDLSIVGFIVLALSPPRPHRRSSD